MSEQCVHKRCTLHVVEGTTRCEKHHEHHRAEVSARAKHRRASGGCGLCHRPAVPGKARCSAHDYSTGAYRCGICGGRGHNRMTCTAKSAGGAP